MSLFVQSQSKANDNLRAFIAAWPALELLVNRLARMLRPEWERILAAQAGELPRWDRDWTTTPPDTYRIRDKAGGGGTL